MEPIYMLLADIHSIGNPLKIRFTVGYKYGQRRLNFIPAKMKNTKVGNDLPYNKNSPTIHPNHLFYCQIPIYDQLNFHTSLKISSGNGFSTDNVLSCFG